MDKSRHSASKYTAFYSLFCVSLLSYFSKLGISIFLANHLTPVMFGDLNIAFRTLSIAAVIILVGTASSANKILSNYIYTHDEQGAISYLAWNMRLLLKTFAILLTFSILLLVIIWYLHRWDLELSDYHLALDMLWIAPLLALINLFSSYIMCNQQPTLAMILKDSGRYLFVGAAFLIALILLLNVNHKETLTLVVFVAFFTVVLIEFVYLKIKLPKIISTKIVRSEVDRSKATVWRKLSIKLIFFDMLFLLINSIDLYLLEIFHPDENSVGHYSACVSVIGIVYLIGSTVAKQISPLVSSLITSERGRQKLQVFSARINSITLLTSGIVLAVIIIFSKNILLFFGVSYVDAQIPLIILAIGAFFSGFHEAPTAMLAYSGNEGVVIQYYVATLLLLLLAGIPVVIYFGMIGISVLVTVGFLLGTSWLMLQSYLKFNIKTWRLF